MSDGAPYRHDHRLFLCAILFVSCLLSAPCLAAESQVDSATVEQLFENLEGRFSALQSLQYSVEREIRAEARVVKERWSFRYRQPDCLRVDYQLPIERQIIVDRQSMWEYIPLKQKAVKTSLSALSVEKKQQFLAGVLSRVSIDGIRLGNFREMIRRTVSVTRSDKDPNLLFIEGTAPKFAVQVDLQKQVLIRTEVYDQKGKLTLRTSASDFLEVAPGFWHPQRLKIVYHTENGFVESEVILSHIKINESLTEDVFQFVPPTGVSIVDN